MKKILVVLTFCLILTSLFSNDVLKIKQKMGSSYNLYWTHNQKNWSSQLVYGSGNKPCLSFSLSPLYSFQGGHLKIKLANYVGLKLDLSNKNWPVKEIMNDSFLIPSINKWDLYLRLTTKINPDKDLSWWSRGFIGYQISPTLNLRIQTEWSYIEKEWTIFLGLAWEYNLTKELSLTTYLAINTNDTKYSHKKTGWIEIKKKF